MGTKKQRPATHKGPQWSKQWYGKLHGKLHGSDIYLNGSVIDITPGLQHKA
jgi:hypothetical protein